MSSVEPSERPLALGVQFLFYRSLAYIPTPIYFGRLIDAACILRQPVSPCSSDEGACELYDAAKFRHIYFGILMGIKLLGGLFLLVCLRFSILRDVSEKNSVEEKNINGRSGTPQNFSRGNLIGGQNVGSNIETIEEE